VDAFLKGVLLFGVGIVGLDMSDIDSIYYDIYCNVCAYNEMGDSVMRWVKKLN